MIAEYRCNECEFEWSTKVEGGTMPLKHNHVHSAECPICGSLYFLWKNFGDSKKAVDN